MGPIKISRGHYRLAQIRRYINTARKRRAAVRNQRGLSGKIASTLGKWRTRQLENSLRKLQEAADNNDMGPIWQYQRKIRMTNTNNQAIIKKEDGTDCQGIEETIKRWEEWAKKNFSKEQEELIPKISHITEQEWEKKFIKPPEDIKQIRENSTLMKMMKKYPEIEEWLNRPYEEEDIMTEIKSLALKKAHGNDGIPGGAYKATMKWAVKPIT